MKAFSARSAIPVTRAEGPCALGAGLAAAPLVKLLGCSSDGSTGASAGAGDAGNDATTDRPTPPSPMPPPVTAAAGPPAAPNR